MFVCDQNKTLGNKSGQQSRFERTSIFNDSTAHSICISHSRWWKRGTNGVRECYSLVDNVFDVVMHALVRPPFVRLNVERHLSDTSMCERVKAERESCSAEMRSALTGILSLDCRVIYSHVRVQVLNWWPLRTHIGLFFFLMIIRFNYCRNQLR